MFLGRQSAWAFAFIPPAQSLRCAPTLTQTVWPPVSCSGGVDLQLALQQNRQANDHAILCPRVFESDARRG